jgi:hypothetical protein
MKTTKRWTRASARRAQARAMTRGGWTRAEVRRGEFPPLRLLVPPTLWREMVALRAFDPAPVPGERD